MYTRLWKILYQCKVKQFESLLWSSPSFDQLLVACCESTFMFRAGRQHLRFLKNSKEYNVHQYNQKDVY